MEDNRDIRDRLIRIETKLDNFGKIETQSNEAYTLSKENKSEIEEINDKMKWLERTIIGGFITVIISAIVYVIKIM